MRVAVPRPVTPSGSYGRAQFLLSKYAVGLRPPLTPFSVPGPPLKVVSSPVWPWRS